MVDCRSRFQTVHCRRVESNVELLDRNTLVLIAPASERLLRLLRSADMTDAMLEVMLEYVWDVLLEGDVGLLEDYVESYTDHYPDWTERWHELCNLFRDIYYVLRVDLESHSELAIDWLEVHEWANCLVKIEGRDVVITIRDGMESA